MSTATPVSGSISYSASWNFSGHGILLTGGSRGIGAAIVRRMVESGGNVIFADIDDSGASELIQSLEDKATNAHYLKHDASDEEVWPLLLAEACRLQITPTLVVPNAGVGASGSIEMLTLDDYENVTRLNIRSAWLAAKHTAGALEITGKGSIVLIGSVMASFGTPDYSLYTVSKSALQGLLHALSVELGSRNIRVNLVTPGFIQLDPPELYRNYIPRHLWREFYTTFGEELRNIPRRFQPLPRCGLPEDIAQAVCFLHSDSASFVTGTELRVDGGLLNQSPIRSGDGVPAFAWSEGMRSWLGNNGIPLAQFEL